MLLACLPAAGTRSSVPRRQEGVRIRFETQALVVEDGPVVVRAKRV